MAIDGIGKGGPPPPFDGAKGTRPGDNVGGAGASGSEFRVERTQSTAGSGSVGSELERLERDEISREEYLSHRVEQATAHLQGRLAPERLEEIKLQLREQLEVDPVLRRLLQRATGMVEGSEPSET